MRSARSPLLITTILLAACTSQQSPTAGSIPVATRAAIAELRVGMSEGEALSIMTSVSLDSGRITWGGTGNGLLYFQISPTQQICIEIANAFRVTRIGDPEPLLKWSRDFTGGLVFE